MYRYFKKIADLILNVEYEATKDCIITGYITAQSFASISCEIDGTYITSFTNNNGLAIQSPVYIYLAKGQKVIFKKNVSGTGNIAISAYSTKE